MKKENVSVIALIIVIVAITTGSITWIVAKKSQVPAQKSVVTQPAPVAQKQPIASPEAQPAPVDKNLDLVYKNEKYGFEFTFDSGYKNIWDISAEKNTSSGALDSFYFTIKNTPTNSDIFAIHVYDQSWWLKNVVVDSNKSAWKKGDDHSLLNAYGIYLGSSDEFAYVLWPNNQSCPDLGESGPGPLCKLTYGKTEMVTNSFKITNK